MLPYPVEATMPRSFSCGVPELTAMYATALRKRKEQFPSWPVIGFFLYLPLSVFQIEQFYDTPYHTLSDVKKSELTPRQSSSVRCPTCGVPAGNHCVLHSGAPRSRPHVDRKFAAIDAIEKKTG